MLVTVSDPSHWTQIHRQPSRRTRCVYTGSHPLSCPLPRPRAPHLSSVSVPFSVQSTVGQQVEAQLDCQPGPKSGSAGKSESRGPENRVPRWRRPNSDICLQNYHFGLVYDVIYQFLGMEAKNYKFGMFCQQCHPSVAPGDADIRPRNQMPPGFTPAICLCRNFVYIFILENREDKSVDQNF